MTKDERRDKRIPIGLKVRFKSATIAEFIERLQPETGSP